MCRYSMKPYKSHYVCVQCRRSVKQARDRECVPCPECARPMYAMGMDFQAPRRESNKQWRKLALLVDAGVTFNGCGCNGPGPRPRTLSDTKRYVEAKRQADDRRAVRQFR